MPLLTPPNPGLSAPARRLPDGSGHLGLWLGGGRAPTSVFPFVSADIGDLLVALGGFLPAPAAAALLVFADPCSSSSTGGGLVYPGGLAPAFCGESSSGGLYLSSLFSNAECRSWQITFAQNQLTPTTQVSAIRPLFVRVVAPRGPHLYEHFYIHVYMHVYTHVYTQCPRTCPRTCPGTCPRTCQHTCLHTRYIRTGTPN